MNSDEVQLIKKTWEIPVATPTDSGAAILTQFFNRYPSNLEKFPFRDVTHTQKHTSWRSHTLHVCWCCPKGSSRQGY